MIRIIDAPRETHADRLDRFIFWTCVAIGAALLGAAFIT